MDALYSFALLVSLVTALGMFALTFYILIGERAATPGLPRASKWMGVAAAGCGLLSLATHLTFGHTPGTDRALPVWGFFAEHPAYLAVAGLLMASFLIRIAARRE